MKTAKKIWLIVGAVCTVLGIGIMSVTLFFILRSGGLEALQTIDSDHVPKAVTLTEDFDSIAVSAVSEDITLRLSESGEPVVEYFESRLLTYEIKISDGTLNIIAEDQSHWYDHIGVSFGVQKHGMVITLPKAQYDRLTVHETSGDLTVPAGFTFSSAEIQTVSGEVNWRAAVRDDFSALTVSGDICLQNALPGAMVELKTTSGNVRFSNGEAQQVTVKTVSGDVAFADCDTQRVNITSVSGDITAAFATPKSIKASSVSGEIQVKDDPTASSTCTVTTTSGDITIH